MGLKSTSKSTRTPMGKLLIAVLTVFSFINDIILVNIKSMVSIMAKTIKEIANQLGISKQAVQLRMNDIQGFRSKYAHKVGNHLEINDKGVQLLTNPNTQNRQTSQQDRQPKNDNNGKQVNNLESVILQQLEIKDKQIAQLQKALDQQQQLQLATIRENRKLKDQIQELGGYLQNSKNDKKNDKLANEPPSNTPKEANESEITIHKSQNPKKVFWSNIFRKKS